MFRRPVIGWAFLWLVIASSAQAQITAFWQQQTITPQAIANDPQLASMQCWDLMVMTTGNWASARLRAQLPSGLFFYKHPMGGFKRPSPAAIAQHPALEFTPYVNTPNDNGLNNSNTLIVGGFPESFAPSIGDPAAPFPGTLGITWGDVFVDPPGTYQIARLTFPQNVLPNIANSLGLPLTAQLNPTAETPIPEIPDPTNFGILGAVAMLAIRVRARRRIRPGPSSATCEQLEARRLLSFSASFPGVPTLTPRVDANASSTTNFTEGEAVIAVSPSDPLKLATFAVDGTNPNDIDTNTLWFSADGGLTYTARPVPLLPGEASGGDPTLAFDRAGNLYAARITTNGITVARSPNGGADWPVVKQVPNSSGADKPWILVAPHPTISNQDVLYVWWGGGNVRLLRSDDPATNMNFSEIPNPGQLEFVDSPRIVARRDGKRLFATWWNRGFPSDIRFDWGEYDQFGQLIWHTDQVVDTGTLGGGVLIFASPGAAILAAPAVAIQERLDGSVTAYVTYTKPGSGTSETDVWVARSADPTTGQPWITTNLRPGNTKSQFHAFVSTDPMTAVPYITWFDATNDPENKNVERFMTASTDGGQNWMTPVAISDTVSRPYSPFSYGHYNGNTVFAGMGYDSFPSNANVAGPLDIYTDRAILSGHKITFAGTANADTYDVQMDASNTFVKVWENTSTGNPPTFIMHKDALTGSGAGLLFNLGSGNDVVNIASNVPIATTINGEDGSDSITGGAGDDVINGGNGIDTLKGGGGDNTLDYSTFSVGVTIDLTMTSAGPNGAMDSVPLKDFDNAIGGSGNDVITGNNDPNFLDGRAGADTIDGDSDGNTLSLGQPGEDSILGGIGNDSIFGDGANDTIDGQAGNDTVNGGAGHDSLFGGDDADTMYGDFGNDVMDGGAGNDSMYGQAGHDTLTGGSGSDRLDGAAGDDWFYSRDNEVDSLFGGRGLDRAQADTDGPIDMLNSIEELLP